MLSVSLAHNTPIAVLFTWVFMNQHYIYAQGTYGLRKGIYWATSLLLSRSCNYPLGIRFTLFLPGVLACQRYEYITRKLPNTLPPLYPGRCEFGSSRFYLISSRPDLSYSVERIWKSNEIQEPSKESSTIHVSREIPWCYYYYYYYYYEK